MIEVSEADFIDEIYNLMKAQKKCLAISAHCPSMDSEGTGPIISSKAESGFTTTCLPSSNMFFYSNSIDGQPYHYCSGSTPRNMIG